MTIAERKAREAYDRLNPWRPMAEAQPDGTLCELLFADMAGHFDADRQRYFLDSSGHWLNVDEATRAPMQPMNWRPAVVKLTPERRAIVRRRYENNMNDAMGRAG